MRQTIHEHLIKENFKLTITGETHTYTHLTARGRMNQLITDAKTAAMKTNRIFVLGSCQLKIKDQRRIPFSILLDESSVTIGYFATHRPKRLFIVHSTLNVQTIEVYGQVYIWDSTIEEEAIIDTGDYRRVDPSANLYADLCVLSPTSAHRLTHL